jgi:4-oxalocrotonate tautomerase
MPVVTVRIAKGRPIEKKRSLVKAVSKVVAENLDVPTERVILIIDESDGEDWAVGGILHADKLAASAVKAGANE